MSWPAISNLRRDPFTMPRWTAAEHEYMSRALDLARRGQGLVEPNPMVGCVIVRAGKVVGEGYHRRFGGPHAEVFALRQAGQWAQGADVYVTLEPCCHHGKTPPCTNALIQSGVRRVVAAMIDPNPRVAGRGLGTLRAAGIRSEVGLHRSTAESLNAPFIKSVRQRRPYVILKWAQSIDGKIATRTGESKWISSTASRKLAHALRARVDAIVVGIETVLSDDPELTARYVRPKRPATRIVMDTRLRISPACKLVRTAKRWPTLIVTSQSVAPSGRKATALRRAGCEVLHVASDRGNRRVRLNDLLDVLHQHGMTNILVEGGGRVLGAFVDQGLADEAWIFVAPMLIGGEEAPGALEGRGPGTMSGLPRVSLRSVLTAGSDLCYNVGFLPKTDGD